MTIMKWKRPQNGMSRKDELFPAFPSLLDEFFRTDDLLGGRSWTDEFTKDLPAVNIKQNPEDFELELSLPGYGKDNIRVNVEGDMLVISGESKTGKEEKDDRFTRREFGMSSFKRTFTLPDGVDPEKIAAKYEDGILRVNIGKKENAHSKTSRQIMIA
jgi:HSP20 family protein